jgi:peptidoglycan hydrolase-like protein with peptidoglycan-binding domain
MNMRDIITKLDEITATKPGVKIYTGDNITPQQIKHNYDMVKQGKAKLDVSDHVGNFANDAANALTFGYADNAAAALDAAFDKNKTYAGQMAKYKANAKGYGEVGPSIHVPDSIPLVGGGNITPGDLVGLFTGAGLIKSGAQIGAKLLGPTVGKYLGGTMAFLAPAIGHAAIDPTDDPSASAKSSTPEVSTPAEVMAAMQKVIGAKPDGIYGPETKQKLTAWQQANGLKPDGIPGPQTYGKMAQVMSAQLPASATPAPATESKKGNNMKKITESELIARAAQLRNKLFEYDDGGYDAMGNVTTATPSASPTAVAKPATPAVKWPTTPAEIKAFQTANKLTPDGLIGQKTMAALQAAGATAPAGFKPVGNKAPAKPTPGAQVAPAAGQEQRTPAEIAASADLSSANNAGNINAGLTPDDPRWQGPKPPAASTAQPSGPGLEKLKAALQTGDQKQITQALAAMGEPDSFSPEEQQYAAIANKAVNAGVNAVQQDTRGGVSKFLGINDPNAGNPQKAATQATVAAMTPPAAPTAAAAPAAPTAAAPAGDWESSPVASSKLTPQQLALAKNSGMATTPAQLAALAKQNMASAQNGQPISATPTQESVSFKNDELSRIVNLVHYR